MDVCRGCGRPTQHGWCGFCADERATSAQAPTSRPYPGHDPYALFSDAPEAHHPPGGTTHDASQPSADAARGTTRGLVVGVVAAGAVVAIACIVGLWLLLGNPRGGGDGDTAIPAATVPPSPVTSSTTPDPAPTSVVTITQTVAPSPVTPAPPTTSEAVQEPVAGSATVQEFERYYPLGRGDQGYVVETLQELLTWRGVRTYVDGDFGAATERSVRQWQAQQGLAVTGVVDDTTWDSLVPKLRLGASGDGVAALQRLLTNRGHSIVIDGDFGTQTLGAVKDFQQARGIVVDGIVGPQTWAALLA